MNLLDLVHRKALQAWATGDNIPWNEPEFSRRMLKEHLTQAHDAASRRLETIERHVRFIHHTVLGETPARILDLGCGPGLYAHRLTRLGHSVRGIDFSPASVEYARETAQAEGLSCTFTLGDLRQADFGIANADLVMFIYGEFNVFCPEDARGLLRKAFAALKPGGILLLEISNETSTRQIGAERPAWYTAESGLFSDRPHVMLFEAAWDETLQVATNRHTCIEAATGEVTSFGASYQAYSQAALTRLLEDCGFAEVKFYPSLTGEADGSDFWAITAVRVA